MTFAGQQRTGRSALGNFALPGCQCICIVVCGLGLVALGCSDSTIESGLSSTNQQDPVASEIVSAEKYTDREIGARELVGLFLADRHLFVRYRTFEESNSEFVDQLQGFRSLTPAERDRVYFEQTVELVLWAAEEASPEAVVRADDELREAFYRSLDVCIARSDWPDVRLYEEVDGAYYTGTGDLYDTTAKAYGLTWEDYVDLRHECSKFAASYPVLDSEQRNELVGVLREYYLDALRLWMRDNPDLVVPLDYERSVNHPYQDYVREACQAADAPQECILEEGVGLP